MPQEITTNQTTEMLSDEKILKDPTSVEAYADRLMDDLFQDVERVIEGGTKLPSDPVQPEFVSLKSIKVPQIILPPMSRREDQSEDSAISPDVNLRDASAEKSSQSFDRILLGVAFSSLLVTALLWLATRGGLSRIFAPAPVAVPVATPLDAQTQANIQFADYIERSLKAIEQNTPENIPLLPTFPVTPPVQNLQTVPVPSTPTVSGAETNNLISAINRVEEAIREASKQTASLSNQVMRTIQQNPAQPQAKTPTPGGQTSGGLPASPTTAQAPAAETQNTTASEATSAESEAAPQTEAQTTTASAPEPQAETPVATAPAPEPEPAPEPAPPPATTAREIPQPQLPQTTAAVEATPSASSPAPAATVHTLVGILELGERSAALFEVNGVARRVYVGENVAGSGWTLVEVANQEAIIRRNGEVITIYVGQQF